MLDWRCHHSGHVFVSFPAESGMRFALEAVASTFSRSPNSRIADRGEQFNAPEVSWFPSEEPQLIGTIPCGFDFDGTFGAALRSKVSTSKGVPKMGSTSDKIKGYANEAAGSIKKAAGKVVGSEKLQVKGAVQGLKGEAQVAVGKTKEAIKDGATKTADAINRKL